MKISRRRPTATTILCNCKFSYLECAFIFGDMARECRRWRSPCFSSGTGNPRQSTNIAATKTAGRRPTSVQSCPTRLSNTRLGVAIMPAVFIKVKHKLPPKANHINLRVPILLMTALVFCRPCLCSAPRFRWSGAWRTSSSHQRPILGYHFIIIIYIES